jgi:polyketide synthase PksJ
MQPIETEPAAAGAPGLQAILEPRTLHEEIVRHLYADVLGLPDDRIGRDVSFFSLGGDSLLATMLMARVSKAFEVDLPMRIVFEEETVARLAAQIDELTKRPPQGKPLALRQAGAGNPLFCIHPASGFGRPYLTLLRHLPRDMPVYALEARGLLDTDVLPASIDDMCADYLDQIRAIAPVGPYQLLGWSFGAIAAHAIAIEMQQRGLTVGRLVMIDGSLLENEPWPAQMIAEHRLDLESRLAGYKEYRDATGELKRTMIERMSEVHRNNIRLSYCRPKVFVGDVLMIRPEVGSRKGRGEVWRPYIHGNLLEVVVPYHHNKLLTPEAVELYGAQVSDFMKCAPMGA